MGTEAETVTVAARPAGFTLWTGGVSALAAAALILSVVALTVAGRDRAVTGVAGEGIHQAAGTEAVLWDQGKIDALELRAQAMEGVNQQTIPWDQGKIDALERRAQAMEGVNQQTIPWDQGKIDALERRV